MDHHRHPNHHHRHPNHHHRHPNHHHQQHPQLMDSSSSSSSRYLPLRPPPPPPPSFPDDYPNLFPPPHRHLPPPPPPPPPQHHTLSPRPPPCLFHHPPPHHKPLHHFNFPNSPPHHHHHHHLHHHHDNPHQHHRRIADDDHRDVYRSPPRVILPPNPILDYDHHILDHHHRFRLPELPPPPPPPPSARVPPRSPPHFDTFRRDFEIDSPPRFREDFHLQPRLRSLHPDVIDYHLRRDRIHHDRRVLEDDFDFDRDRHRDHEKYHPEMVSRKEFEMNSSNSEFIRGPLNGEVLVRGGRDDAVMEEIVNVNVNARRGGSREVSRSPIKFRNGGGSEVDVRLTDRGRKEEVQEYNNRGTPEKVVQKKSAFLRIQPPKHQPQQKQQQHKSNNSFRNRYDNATSSPHKGKELNLELDRRISEERVGSPVELDVSFKSNALVAKAIMAASSCSGLDFNVNNALSDSSTRIDGESPSKVESFRNHLPVSKQEEKEAKNRVRLSPIMKRLGTRNNSEGRNDPSDMSPVESSRFFGRITRKASPKGEILGKDKKEAGPCKVSFLTVRKKRKAVGPLSRLSSLVPAKADCGLVNVDDSANHLTPAKADCGLMHVYNSASHSSDGSEPSDSSVKQSGIELICGGSVIGSTQNESFDTGKIDVNESVIVVGQEAVAGHSVSEASAPMRMKEEKMLEAFPGSLGSLEPGVSEFYGNTMGNLQNEQRISNPHGDVTKSVDKCSSDIHSGIDSVKGQDVALGLVNNGSVEGSSESVVVHMEDNVNNNDVCSKDVDTLNSVAIVSSILIPDNVLNKEENRMDLNPMVNVEKPCETQVFSSSENATIGLSLGGLYSDTSFVPELRHSEGYLELGSFSIDVSTNKSRISSSHEGNVTIGSGNSNIISDVRDTNDIQDQQRQGLDTTLVNDEPTQVREESSKTCMYSGGGVLAFSVEEGSSLFNRKRKVENEPKSLDSKIFESCHDSALSVSFPIEKAMLPVEKLSPPGLGSSYVESDVSHGNEFTGSFVEGMNFMNHIRNVDPIEYSSSCGKKRRILPLESVSTDQLRLGSESSDLPAFADGHSAEHLPQLVQEFALSNSLIHSADAVGGSTSSLCAETCSIADNSKSDFLCKDSSLSIAKIALPDAEQSYTLELGCNPIVDGNLMMAGANDDIEFGAHCRMETDDRGDGIQCLSADHIGDADHGSLAVNMECDDNSAFDANPSPVSGSLQSCGKSTYDGATNVSDTPSDADLSGVHSHCSPTLDTSIASPPIEVVSGEKLSIGDKKSNRPLATQSLSTSQANLPPEHPKNNSKPVTSTSLGVQQLNLKSVSLLSKHGQTTMSSSNSMSRPRRNVLIRSEASLSTIHCSSVTKPSQKTEPYPAKPRTWHRTINLAASIPVKKPPPPHKPLYGKALKVQDTSYIRKGNSLVRNPAPGAATSGSRSAGASMIQSKPNETDRIRKVVVGSVMTESAESPDGLVTGGRSTPIEMPKTPPLPCSGKTSDNDIAYSGECSSSLYVDQSEGTDNEEALKFADAPLNSFKDPESALKRNLEDPGMVSDGDLLGSSSKRMIYIKCKSNQLIAASQTSQSSVSNMDKTLASSSDTNYYKRRKNQLIRASSEGNIQQMIAGIQGSSKCLSRRALQVYSGRTSTKRLSNKVKSSKFSLVWKLGDSESCGKGVDALRSGRLLSHLLPWKRATYWSRRLLSSKKRGAVYVRSGRGFSLRRSKVISLAGTSLKWSKSMEKRSKKVEEEAARAISAMDSLQNSGFSGISSKAESNMHSLHKPVHGLKLHSGDRIFRIGVFRYRMDPSRRTLQRITDEEATDVPQTEKDARKTYVPKRLLIGSDEYVRIGNGNQLVRDPKRRTRILASEKVRWSLHTARMRLAKKRKFCQFFTRFGKCNKGEGKCPFIHDPSKIAVCTKFLKGLCADPNCKLTHKVIPERMPDCSFFLQGLCSNEKCPYRHVNVNPKASICESFLRGYCAEGNECRKKHSYICPEFEASGSCPQGSKCKLYHPKKGKTKKRKVLRDLKNAKGRYFGSGLSVVADLKTSLMLEKHAEPNRGSQGELGDFIGLDVSDDDAQVDGLMSEQTFSFEDDPLDFSVGWSR